MPTAKLNLWLGLLALLFSCVMLFVWIPLDVDTGIVEKVRRQTRLGDAFAPTISALIIGLGGVLLLLQRIKHRPDHAQSVTPSHSSTTPSKASYRSLTQSDFVHLVAVLLIASLAIFLMRYVGPLVLGFVEGDTAQYRLLRDTVPWKYLGFGVGGVFLVVALIAYIEKRLRPFHFLVAIIAVLLLIAFYDLPFDNLLLPPNGDV